ncbi:hypothetical protein PRIPAC_90886 [Pristionchus pacificus]|uniref:Uncharacterized protein n=1 Tax=Pristionchus pacificus TaxID=54126 RepID=A0A2A6B6T6_PRIPA|nr:hypothetical protein PRIPAC_90886 [Pristionchus pacificus]|eukprot:PDM61563.1 hypothetical protein PRIPAC_51005 [Pristionchus pacificus]
MLRYGFGIFVAVTLNHFSSQVHDNKQALATCLEYFPTTFVTGVQSGNKVKCTVKAAYTCVDANHFLMYDKCYYFSPTPVRLVWLAQSTSKRSPNTSKWMRRPSAARNVLAENWPPFTRARTPSFSEVMEANRRGIDKLGIGMTTDGMTIDEENGKTSMLHKNMWKLIEGDYWEGDKLVKLEKGDKPDYAYPSTANYLFMRTQTDHIFNRIQGSFERATADVAVTFACEVPTVFTEQQRWYCDKMGRQGLGLGRTSSSLMRLAVASIHSRV